jgi:hypothetical protein
VAFRDRRQALLIASVLAVVLAAACVYLIVGLRGPSKAPPPPRFRGTAPPVSSAARFLDSVGVNVHLTYLDTSYARFDEWTARLKEAGIRHVRDGVGVGNTAAAPALQRLQAAGVRLTLITSLDRSPEEQVAAARQFGTGLDALEAPNEADNQGREDWATALRTFLPALRTAVDDGGARPPILGPSFVRAASALEVRAAAPTWDIDNVHPYPGGGEPSANLEEVLAAVRDAGPPGAPVQATETGYHNAVRASEGQPGVSEQAAAAYIPRLLLDYFSAGIERTFIYELLDEKADPGLTQPEMHFGLLRADLTPKPAFIALRNFMRVIHSSDEPGHPTDVRVAARADVHARVLKRADGSAVLALWRSAAVWDTSRRTSTPVRPVDVRVHFAPAARIAVYRPDRSERPVVRRDGAANVTVPVAGDVTLVSYG